VTAQGGASFTTAELKLDVGCTNAVLIPDASFISSSVLGITDPKTGFYTYVNPNFDLSYCSVVSNTLKEIFIDSTSSSKAVVLQTGSNTVVDMDSSITTEVTVSFKVQSTFTGGFTWTCPTISISVLDCSTVMVTITSTLTTAQTMTIPVGSTIEGSKKYFTSFTCSDPVCCSGPNALVYDVSATNTLTTLGVTGIDPVGD
jgi:hypothetical protein